MHVTFLSIANFVVIVFVKSERALLDFLVTSTYFKLFEKLMKKLNSTDSLSTSILCNPNRQMLYHSE